MDKLQEFYNDKAMMKAVDEHFTQVLRNYAADQAIIGNDTKGVKEASDVIQRAFAEIEKRYSRGKIIEQNTFE